MKDPSSSTPIRKSRRKKRGADTSSSADSEPDPSLADLLRQINQPPLHRNLAQPDGPLPLIKVVGLSAAGKSTLVRQLRAAGYNARPVSQEHSNIPDLWQQFDPPDILIYLDITLEAQEQRRPDVSWSHENLHAERARLDHARGLADLHINTANMTDEAVFAIVRTFLSHAKIGCANYPLSPLTPTGMVRNRTDA